MQIYTIYVVTNLINSKQYVGFDSAWPKRMQSHKNEAYAPTSHTYNTKFHRAIRKHGWENFAWMSVYQSLDGDHTLNSMERYFIDEYRSYAGKKGHNGYNLTLGGEGQLGRVMSEKTRRKKSAALKGKPTKLSRPVQTPLGTFPGIQMAAEYYGLHHRTVLERIRRASFSDWKFVDDVNSNYITTLRNGNAKQIQTPHGIFDSIRACSKKLNISISTIQSRVTSTSQPDWFFTGCEEKKGTRSVITPEGTFCSITQAATVLGMPKSTVAAKIRSQHSPGWRYADIT